MKRNFKITCLVILFSITSLCSFSIPVVPNYDTVIKEYMESQITSNYKKLNNALDANCTLDMSLGDSLIKQNKDELIEFMKNNVITQQDCSSSYQLLAKTDAVVVAVIDFKHKSAIQENFVTIEKNKNHDWKITNIYRIFTTENSVDTIKATNEAISASINLPLVHSRI